MEQFFVEYINDLAKEMIEKAYDGKTVYAVLFYDEAIELMRCAMECLDVEPCDIEIAPEEVSGYDKEYYIVLDADMVLHVQPAWHEKNEYFGEGYYDFDADCVYIDGDASSAILRGQNLENCFEIVWEDEDDDMPFDRNVYLALIFA